MTRYLSILVLLLASNSRAETKIDGRMVTGEVGATLVTATGSTTSRSLAARGADVVNVRDYGATGDGSTDDTNAIRAAVAAAAAFPLVGDQNGAQVFLPRGNYRVTGSITVSADGVRLVGEGQRSTVITVDANASTDGVVFQKTPLATVFRVGIARLSVYAKTSHTSVRDLVVFSQVAHASISDLDLYGAARHGLYLANTVNVGGTNVYALGCLGSGLYIDSVSGGEPTTVRFVNLHVNGDETSTAPGVDVVWCSGLALIGPTIEKAGAVGDPANGAGVRIQRGEVEIVGPHFEGNTGWDLDAGTNAAQDSFVAMYQSTHRLLGRKQAGYGGARFGRVKAGSVIGANFAAFTSAGTSLAFTTDAHNIVALGNRYATTAPPTYNGGGAITGMDGIIQTLGADGLQVLSGYWRPQISGANVLYAATAAPSSGTYARGDVVLKTNPAAGGVLGWVCVTGGTPGTWAPLSYSTGYTGGTIANGGTASIDAAAYTLHVFTATDTAGATMTVDAPTNPVNGELLTVVIVAGAGNAVTVTWNGTFKFAGGTKPTDPAAGKRRTVQFMYEAGAWRETFRSSGDV